VHGKQDGRFVPIGKDSYVVSSKNKRAWSLFF